MARKEKYHTYIDRMRKERKPDSIIIEGLQKEFKISEGYARGFVMGGYREGRKVIDREREEEVKEWWNSLDLKTKLRWLGTFLDSEGCVTICRISRNNGNITLLKLCLVNLYILVQQQYLSG